MEDFAAARLPLSLAGKFQEALDACEGATKCETPAVLAAPEIKRNVRFDLPEASPLVVLPSPPDQQHLLPTKTGFSAWILGKKGWVGAVVGIVLISLLAVLAMYVRKRFISPLIFGDKKQVSSTTQQQQQPHAAKSNGGGLPPPPVIPAFARRHVRFQEERKAKNTLSSSSNPPPPLLPPEEETEEHEEVPVVVKKQKKTKNLPVIAAEDDPGFEPI